MTSPVWRVWRIAAFRAESRGRPVGWRSSPCVTRALIRPPHPSESRPRQPAVLRDPTTSRALDVLRGGSAAEFTEDGPIGDWRVPRLYFAGGLFPPRCIAFGVPFLRKESTLSFASRFRPPPLVPGLLSFRHVILLPAGPTRPIQRLPIPGRVRPFPHPELPLLFPGLSYTWGLAIVRPCCASMLIRIRALIRRVNANNE
jgi:hypothetical protein